MCWAVALAAFCAALIAFAAHHYGSVDHGALDVVVYFLLLLAAALSLTSVGFLIGWAMRWYM